MVKVEESYGKLLKVLHEYHNFMLKIVLMGINASLAGV